MIDFIFGTVWGWIGTAGVVVIVCGLVAWFVPGFRRIAIEVAGVFIASAAIYAKAQRDEAARQQRLKDAAVAKARADYAKIDARPDDPGTVGKRLKDGSF